MDVDLGDSYYYQSIRRKVLNVGGQVLNSFFLKRKLQNGTSTIITPPSQRQCYSSMQDQPPVSFSMI